jgi:hypothetical protein
MVFGYTEGSLLLQDNIAGMEKVHRVYKPVIAVVSTIMGIGFWIFFTNVFITSMVIFKNR